MTKKIIGNTEKEDSVKTSFVISANKLKEFKLLLIEDGTNMRAFLLEQIDIYINKKRS